MDISELSQIHYTYVRIRLDNQKERYQNDNFTKLLEYIGKCYPIANRNAIGCAYKVIQKETNRLLHVSLKKNWDLRTSKKEISSIRQARYWIVEKTGRHYYLRIPYKISYIFTAICNIVREISPKTPIPIELRDCINHAYGYSFYAYYITNYDIMYRLKFRQDALQYGTRQNPAKLYNEFHSPGNIFDTIFCGEL